MPRPDVHTTPVGEHDLAELQALVLELQEGFNRKEARVLDRPFAADAVVVVPDGTMIRGWDELFAYHTARLATAASTWKMRSETLSVVMPGPDTAVVHFRQEMTTPNGDFANHGTAVAVRRDGRWWIGALHNTNVVE
ncbi:SgcJ/EcaC family oxidoreductase [Spirillospora sp. NPDC029432]|uniref:YybH family protein n=1 Tax=Spirillospora sp. NPDC029432 TaxID=3154599 RepID=UPI0034570B62